MKEEVIIQSIGITKKKEQTFFQVKLPRDTHKIIGIETGLYILAAPPNLFVPLQDNSGFIRRNNMIGILQLQTNGKANIFYSKEIFERDINIGAGEIKIIPDQPNKEEKLAVLKASMQRLDKITVSPRTEVVLNVLNHAREQATQVV